MFALLFVLEYPKLPWHTAREASRALFNTNGHGIRFHYAFWKDWVAQENESIAQNLGDFYYTILKQCGFLEPINQRAVDEVKHLLKHCYILKL